MSINLQAISGTPLVAVIDALCMAVTPRWRDFRGEVVISKNRLITCHDPEYLRFGIQTFGGSPSEQEIQDNEDAAEFSRCLQPLFSALAEGKLVIFARELPARPASKAVPITMFMIEEPWELNLFGGATFSTLDHNGKVTGRFKLADLVLPSTADETVARIRNENVNHPADIEMEPAHPGGQPQTTGADAAESAPALRRKVRGRAKQDEPYLVEMQNLIVSGEVVSPWVAAGMIVDQKKVPGNSLPESKIKRLHKAYKDSGRPRQADARNNTQVTQK